MRSGSSLPSTLHPAALRRRFTLWRHRGTRYRCPFCGYRARDLAPTGEDLPVLAEKRVVGGGRRRAACYQCGSTDRERLVLAYLRDELRLLDSGRDRRILHVAPEPNLSRRLREHGFVQYVCGDLRAPGYVHPDEVLEMDVLALPFPDGAFDLVVCNHVLEHVGADRVAMRELRRVLAAGGTAILQVPIASDAPATDEDPSIVDPRERERRFGRHDHVRLYGRDYADRLTECGFTVARVSIAGRYPEMGLDPDEELFVSTA
jgi:SAM-dependent methyltransferase